MFIEFDNWRSWATEYSQWLDTRFDKSVLDRFSEKVEPGWLEWLDSEQSKITGPESSTELFLEQLEAKFDGVRLFHATRLPDIDRLRQDGLRAWSPDDLREMARQKFNTAPRDELERAIALANPTHRGGRVYTFLLLRDAIPGRCVSFSTHGSEWLQAVGMALGAPLNELCTSTHAYLIALDIPWTPLDHRTRLNLAQDALLTTLTLRFFNPDRYSCPAPLGTCVSLNEDIPPSWIASVANLDDLVARDQVTADMLRWSNLKTAK